MVIHKHGINYPMHAVAFDEFDDDAARDYVVRQVNARRPAHPNKDAAREELAGEIGVAPGTLYNIIRQRRKSLSRLIIRKIHDHLLQCLEAEFVRIERDLAVARRRGMDDSSRNMRAVASARDEIGSAIRAASERDDR